MCNKYGHHIQVSTDPWLSPLHKKSTHKAGRPDTQGTRPVPTVARRKARHMNSCTWFENLQQIDPLVIPQ